MENFQDFFNKMLNAERFQKIYKKILNDPELELKAEYDML